MSGQLGLRLGVLSQDRVDENDGGEMTLRVLRLYQGGILKWLLPCFGTTCIYYLVSELQLFDWSSETQRTTCQNWKSKVKM